MSDHAVTTNPRTRTHEIVDKLLAERQQMLVLFCRVAGLEPYADEKEVWPQLQEFCQVLVDYAAFGYFEIFDRIIRGEERRAEVRQVADKVYPRIAAATEFAVAFNDRYDKTTHAQGLDHLSEDLSLLGEEIASRVEMEDQLISALVGR